jgi:hypothetical protein
MTLYRQLNDGFAHYRIYRHNETTSTFSLVGISFGTSFEDLWPRAGQTTTYGIQAVNGSGLMSSMVTISVNESTVAGDHTPPRITEAHNIQANQVWVVFDEAIDSITALSTTHYAINNSVQVLSAGLAGNGRSAVLTTSNLTNGQSYTVTVTNIKDRASPANILTSATVQFSAIIMDTSGMSGDTVLTLLAPDRDTVYHLGDALKVMWASYNGPVVPELSLNNGRSYPIALSDIAISGTSVSWPIPKDSQYLTDSAKVKITDYIIRERVDISASRFRIRAPGAQRKNDLGLRQPPAGNAIIITRQSSSARLQAVIGAKGISPQWRMFIVGMDGRTRGVLQPEHIDAAGLIAEFSVLVPGISANSVYIAIVRDERGIERARGMLPAAW